MWTRPLLCASLALFLVFASLGCGDDDSADAGVDTGRDTATPDTAADTAPDTAVDAEDAAVDSGPEELGGTPASELALAEDPPGQWYPGDMHVHATGASNDTGGDSFPEDIKRVAMERGIYFVVLTDHSNSTGSDVDTTDEDPALFNMGSEFPYWDRAAELSEPGVFLMIDGNEISPVADGEAPLFATGHIGCAPMDLATFDHGDLPFIDRPRGMVTGGDALGQALARGCFSIVNHPYAAAVWTAYDWTDSGAPGFGYHAMEVWNGTLSYGGDDKRAHDAWRCDLIAGANTTPIGASDCHRVNTEPPGQLLDPALGYPVTEVFARDGSWDAIVEGLLSGKVAIREGESHLYLDGYDADGQHATGDAITQLRVRVAMDPRGHPLSRLRLTRATSCDDTRPAYSMPPVVEEDVIVDAVFGRRDPVDLVFPAAGPGVYTATLVTPQGKYSALSRGLVIP